MAGRRIGLLGIGLLAVAVQTGVILWRGSSLVLSDAGPGGDLRIALVWTVLGLACGALADRRGASELALWLGSGFWLLVAVLLWLQALAGKPTVV